MRMATAEMMMGLAPSIAINEALEIAKVYTDEVQKHTGNVVPLTDLAGVSTIVDTLRYNSNAGVKIAAIDALRYLNRPEYKEEIASVLTLAVGDTNPLVARNAAVALKTLDL